MCADEGVFYRSDEPVYVSHGDCIAAYVGLVGHPEDRYALDSDPQLCTDQLRLHDAVSLFHPEEFPGVVLAHLDTVALLVGEEQI